jgi:predicted O-methyltransferase YrrM
MRKTLRRLVPIPIREWLDVQMEKRRLAGQEPLPGDLSRLRRFERGELAAVLCSKEMAEEWREVAEKLSTIGLPDRALGLNPGDRRMVYSLVRTLRPRSVLEVGTHIGASTAHIALAQRRGRPRAQDLALTTVDVVDVNDPVTQPWRRYGASLSPRELVAAVAGGDGVRFVHQGSLDFLERCEPQSYDFVFLDGDHRAVTVYREITRTLDLLRPGGVVLLHDYYPDLRRMVSGDELIAGPYLATERLKSEIGLGVLPVRKLPWPTTLGSNVTSMALLSGAAAG